MSVEFVLSISTFLVAVALIAIGVAAAISPAWASVSVGSILLLVLFASRMRTGGRKE